MKLSVCMIVKNEAAEIGAALASVQSVADEIVVVDTGSTDDTVNIVRAAGARLGHFEWCDDFSAARNAALEMASGDWVFWLDGDEQLLPEYAAVLKKWIQKPDLLAATVQRRDLVSADDRQTYSLMAQWRLFRNRPDLRFIGLCHPRFSSDIRVLAKAEGLYLEDAPIEIEHTGYVAERKEGKLKRGRRLLELELKERPGQLYYLAELFRTQILLGEKAAAEQTLQAAADVLLAKSKRQHQPDDAGDALVLETLLQLAPKAMPKGWNHKKAAALAERWRPNAPPLLWFRAQVEFSGGALDQAEKLLRRLVELGQTEAYDRTCSFDPRIVGDDAKLNLAGCLIRLGKLAEARQILRALAVASSRQLEARQNLEAIQHL